jgi:RHS repeat-associated protein
LVKGWLYQDQLRPVAQLDGSGTNVVARFVYGSKANVPDYMITSGGTYRILSDHLGSPRAVVDVSSGNLIETINFDEFGNETDTLAGTLPTGYVRIPFGFAGGLYDPDTMLVRFGARDYDASVGRWMSKDPTRFSGGTNLYGYVLGDPVNKSDPSGRGPACNFAGAYCQETGDTCACVCTAAKICTQEDVCGYSVKCTPSSPPTCVADPNTGDPDCAAQAQAEYAKCIQKCTGQPPNPGPIACSQ